MPSPMPSPMPSRESTSPPEHLAATRLSGIVQPQGERCLVKDPLSPAPTVLVSFPVPDIAQPDEPAGYLFVRLVVLDPRDPTGSRSWEGVGGMCVQGGLNEHLVERRSSPRGPALMEPRSEHDIAIARQRSAHWESRHYPLLNAPYASEDEAFLIRPYRAALELAEAPWYGPAGKAIDDQLAGAYRDAQLHLLTYVCH